MLEKLRIVNRSGKPVRVSVYARVKVVYNEMFSSGEESSWSAKEMIYHATVEDLAGVDVVIESIEDEK